MLGGHPVPVALAVADVGDLDARDVTVVASAPDGTAWAAGSPDGWACDADGARLTCTRGELIAGVSEPLTANLVGDVGGTGSLGDLVVSARAPGADPAEDARVPVAGRPPSLAVRTATAPVVVLGDETVQVSFAVDVAEGSDAGDVARASRSRATSSPMGMDPRRGAA